MRTRIDPATKRIRVLYGRAPSEPYYFALEDPRIEVQAALPCLSYATPSADLEFARRLARVYLPRTRKVLVESTDLIILDDIDSAIFTDEQLLWFREAVVVEGLGMMMGGGSQGFGGNPPFVGWSQTHLTDIIPVECPYDKRLGKDYLVKFKIKEPGNELARSLPWESAPLYYPPNLVIPREGCRLVIVSKDKKETPVYFFWDVGKGRFVGVQNIRGSFGREWNEWDYFQDSVLNTFYYTAAYPLPSDLVVVHEIRRAWQQIRIQRQLLAGLVDFADKFGANTRLVDDRQEEVEAIRSSSDELYLSAQYSSALIELKKALIQLSSLEELVVKLKDRALVWIYVIEWMTVVSTLLITGVVLWVLMIQRRIYREVPTTSAL